MAYRGQKDVDKNVDFLTSVQIQKDNNISAEMPSLNIFLHPIEFLRRVYYKE